MASAQHQSFYETVTRNCCSKCLQYLKPIDSNTVKEDKNIVEASNCWLCLGLWQEEGENKTDGPISSSSSSLSSSSSSSTTTKSCLRRALEECCRPYGGIGRNSRNRFSQLADQSHTVSLSGDLCLRYRWLASLSPSSAKVLPFSVFQQDLKKHLYSRIWSIIQSDSKESGDKKEDENSGWIKDHQQLFEKEEQGSLSIHLLCLPPKDHPMNIALNAFIDNHKNCQKKKKQWKRYNKRQKCGPFTTQGGDPRQNLEVRLRSKGHQWISQSTAEELLSTVPVSPGVSPFESIFLREESALLNDSHMMIEYHVAVFRRPIFLYGYYTKSRRDVSQTPFVVMREKKSSAPQPTGNSVVPTNNIDFVSTSKKVAETLGVTSVEEQICGPIQDLLKVSTQNNLTPDRTSSGGSSGGVLYGMIKFHASGREDMDVRMLVRSNSPNCHGRPFCVQIIDTLNPITSPNQLKGLVKIINHTAAKDTTKITKAGISENTRKDSGDDLCNTGATHYGQNPMGVGIFPDDFRLVPAAVFSGLQKDTESKTKYYGCHCWSKNALPDVDDLTKFIFRDVVFPLKIQQRTPFRVLHRRTNLIRERNILHAMATKIDSHHFRLELRTQAGTYVKEFVYGDFGRTIPSISSLMGCKTNLLILDCEGIEILTEEHLESKASIA